MDIGGWLRSLGLEEYETAFRENKVDAAVLPKLTAEDLKDLGIGAVGDRRKLLEAIADLRLGTKPDLVPSEAPSTIAEPAKDTAAERRQVTVMFSDLVGSTALSARMDPEDLREVISAYQKCVAETVQRFGGFVAKSWAMACWWPVHGGSSRKVEGPLSCSAPIGAEFPGFGGDAPGLVTGEQLARGPPSGLILAIDEGQRLPVAVAHDETRSGFLNGPRRWEAAFSTDRHACR
jgi:SAM domain (Sterile alpha motif)